MKTNQSSRGANFDFVANLYRWFEYATFGPLLQRVRMSLLPRVTERRRALLFGEGDGRFTARLLACNAEVIADAVDTSSVMLNLLQRRVERVCGTPALQGRLRPHHQDALGFVPSFRPDLVVTHFFLDCLTQDEVDVFVRRLAPLMAPGGLWIVSDFRVPSGVMRIPAASLIGALYFGFRMLTGLRVRRLPDYETAMTRAGLVRIACRRWLFGVLTSELWQTASGTTEPRPGRPASCRS